MHNPESRDDDSKKLKFTNWILYEGAFNESSCEMAYVRWLEIIVILKLHMYVYMKGGFVNYADKGLLIRLTSWYLSMLQLITYNNLIWRTLMLVYNKL